MTYTFLCTHIDPQNLSMPGYCDQPAEYFYWNPHFRLGTFSGELLATRCIAHRHVMLTPGSVLISQEEFVVRSVMQE